MGCGKSRYPTVIGCCDHSRGPDGELQIHPQTTTWKELHKTKYVVNTAAVLFLLNKLVKLYQASGFQW